MMSKKGKDIVIVEMVTALTLCEGNFSNGGKFQIC